jgi:hypothetical protein
MLKYAPEINQTLKGLAAVVDNQAPVVRFFLRNWPITLLAGTALTARLMQRYKKKELTAYNTVVDVGTIVGPVASMFLLVKLAGESEREDETTEELADAVQRLQNQTYQTPHADALPIVRQIG